MIELDTNAAPGHWLTTGRRRPTANTARDVADEPRDDKGRWTAGGGDPHGILKEVIDRDNGGADRVMHWAKEAGRHANAYFDNVAREAGTDRLALKRQLERDLGLPADRLGVVVTRDHPDGYSSEFDVDAGRPWTFHAGLGAGTWHAAFEDPRERITLTGEAGGRAVRVMREAFRALDQFVEDRGPTRFFFTADRDEPSRVRLYDHAAPRLAARHGYALERRETGGPGGDVEYHFTKVPGPTGNARRHSFNAWWDLMT